MSAEILKKNDEELEGPMKQKIIAVLLVCALLLPVMALPARAWIDHDRLGQSAAGLLGDTLDEAKDLASLPLSTLFSIRGFFILFDALVTRLVQILLGAVNALIPSAQSRTELADYQSEHFLAGFDTFAQQPGQFSLGYDSRSIMPDDFGEKAYRMGGYDFNKAATQTYDDLRVRTIVLDDGTGRGAMAYAVLDVIGLANSDVRAIRARLSDMVSSGKLAAINVAVTHTHSAIDSQGLWGNNPLIMIPNNIAAGLLPGIVSPMQGVDPTFLEAIVSRTAQSIRDAYARLEEGTLYYSKTGIADYLNDKAQPYVMDDNLYRLRFVPDNKASDPTVIANFSAHPERVGLASGDYPGNVVSADFVPYIEQVVNAAGANFMFIQGPIGTRISANTGVVTAQGLNRIEWARHYGAQLGEVIVGMDNALEETVKPYLNIALTEVLVEVKNPVLKAAGKLNLANNTVLVDRAKGKTYTVTEVGYMELGDSVKILLQPGETSPELLLGGSNLTAAGSVTGQAYPYAPLRQLLGEDLIVFDLVNDSIGYIIPDSDSTNLLIRYIDGELTDEGSIGANFNDSLLLAFSNRVATTVTKAFLDLVESVT